MRHLASQLAPRGAPAASRPERLGRHALLQEPLSSTYRPLAACTHTWKKKLNDDSKVDREFETADGEKGEKDENISGAGRGCHGGRALARGATRLSGATFFFCANLFLHFGEGAVWLGSGS